ncbi:MAG: heparinase II/III family protein [Clostridia bacterium]|nr:heparinase II/III family protein [Clostridia bacterium]
MNLLGKAHSSEFWAEVRESERYKGYRDELLATWERHTKDYQPDCLKYSEFKLFWTTGDRDLYQRPYFHRRSLASNAALLSLIYPDQPAYLEKLMDILYAICDEYTWCLPAHQGKLEPNNNCRIDLFASETGFMLAEMDLLLRDRLDPLIHNRIMAETERRIVKPFCGVENYGWWENGSSNWTAVCMCSVSCTLMILYPQLVDEAFIARANKAMDKFLTGFGSDGVCFEGCGYWGYGFGFFVMYADMLRTFTEGKYDYFAQEMVKKVATFPQKMFLSGNAGVSFSDGGRTLGYGIWIMHYLKTQYPDDILVYSPKYGGNGAGKFATHLRSALWMVQEYKDNPADNSVTTEFYAPGAQWLTKRTPYYGFAAKGGCNAEMHNHNDVGSFIFAKDGKQLLMDLGSGHYTRQYFAADTRYTILECSSRGHSVPLIGGACQVTGAEAKASGFKYEDGTLSMDIAGAYRVEGLESIERSFSFTEDAVNLTDKFVYSGSEQIVDRIVSFEKAELVAPDTVQVQSATVKFDPSSCDCVINTEQTERGATCYLIDFKLKKGVSSFSCTIR